MGFSGNGRERCPICGEWLKSHERDEMRSRTIYQCPLCGDFIIDDMFPRSKVKPSAMLYYVLQKKANTTTVFICNADAMRDDDQDAVTPETLDALIPQTFSERIDKSLLNIAAIIDDNIDEKIDSQEMIIHRAVWTKDVRESSQAFLNLLVECGYLTRASPNYYVTAQGWMRIEELQRAYRHSNTAFVAMWFDDTMKEAREAIKQAVEECGYQFRIIDEKEHNNQIVPEIFYEIKQSRFVISDLTGHRTGVYYEAGFAEGIGKQVILTCRQDDFEMRHFDVAQKSTVIWADKNDLKERLIKRIVATVGKAN